MSFVVVVVVVVVVVAVYWRLKEGG